MNIKAICTDIDGTLLNKDRVLSQRLLRAIAKLPSDFPIILASSRMPAAMRHLLADMGRSGNPLISYNGGYLIDDQADSPRVLDNVAIDLDLCEQLNGLGKNTEIHLSLYHGEEWYEPQYDFWAERESVNTKVQPVIKSAEDVFQKWKSESKGAHKVMCMGPSAEIDHFYHEALQKMGDYLHLYRSKDTYIEIAPKSISKASALKLLLEKKYDIKMEEVMAFGDNYNDIELLQQVGLGVAVANAREEVKAVANEMTASNKEEGVALMIEKYLTGE